MSGFWTCDEGHANAIPDGAPRRYRAYCQWCLDDEAYIVEPDVPEDDPLRMTSN